MSTENEIADGVIRPEKFRASSSGATQTDRDGASGNLLQQINEAKAANAFLYLAIEALSEVVVKMPEWSGKAMRNSFSEDDGRNYQDKIGKLNEMMASAHSWIWDEDGKPR